MNRSDLQALQAVRGYPAVTILIPTLRAFPEDQQNAIRIKNLVREATNRLLAEFPRRAITRLLTRLNTLAARDMPGRPTTLPEAAALTCAGQ